VFDKFDRVRRPDVFYAGMMEYDGDLHIRSTTWSRRRRSSADGRDPRGRACHAARDLRDQKYGHVTYFWNGNRSGMFDEGTETYIEIPSDNLPFNERPG